MNVVNGKPFRKEYSPIAQLIGVICVQQYISSKYITKTKTGVLHMSG